MSKINVNIENLEIAVTNFLYASKEAGEINYRLKLLGNELSEDVDLLASPEYEMVMSCYTNASAAVNRINEFFESLLQTVIKTPEMYSDAEKESINRINSLVAKSKIYQKSVTDNSAFAGILEKAKDDDINVDGLADLVNKGYQSVNMSILALEGIDIDSFEKAQTNSGDVADKVNSSFESVAMSQISTAINDESNKE
ncbi:MAG: hypothetical protein J1E81_00525 [Eubacterium sp.]|nr:hypothetical protein [Eubacterium sp.]